MKKYPKIHAPYYREPKGDRRLIEGMWSLPEFEALAPMPIWDATEKIDGTNIRIIWVDGKLEFRGRTDKANIQPYLLPELERLFPVEKLERQFGDVNTILFGEGYGHKIQAAGKQYSSDGHGFVLFDVFCGGIWLRYPDTCTVAGDMDLEHVPLIYGGYTLYEIMDLVAMGPNLSVFGTGTMEGLVCTTNLGLRTRRGDRVTTKIKVRDFCRE